uniref:Uncharacterized protein n=1 Tax=Desertifilum tharense IPPAS B-1220 TaxID=1781255 RepID=A0ACD5GNX6_9CYAN
MGVGEEGNWELGVGGWGRRELGVRSWGRRELGVGSWGLGKKMGEYRRVGLCCTSAYQTQHLFPGLEPPCLV